MGNTCCGQKDYENYSLPKRNIKKHDKDEREELQKAHRKGKGPDAGT